MTPAEVTQHAGNTHGAASHPSPEKATVPALDGLRGLAVLMVMSAHLFWSNPVTGSRIGNFLSFVAHAGWIGVDLFFVLSGFLITRILFSTRHDPHYRRNFYSRRVLRIFPLHYMVLGGTALAGLALHWNWQGTLPWYLLYVANLRPSGPIPLFPDPSPHWQIIHFWSLQVEEQFYLVWPFLILWLDRPRRILLAGGLLSACAFFLRLGLAFNMSHLNNEYWIYAFTPCRMDTLLTGSMLAILWFSRARAHLARWATPVFFACMAIVLYAGWRHGEVQFLGSFFFSTFGFTILAIAGAALIAMALSGGWVARIFSVSPMRALGRYSYGLYVFHFPLWLLLTTRVHAFLAARLHSRMLIVATSGLLLGTVSFAVAWLSYQLIEKRFLRLKRLFPYRRAVVFQQPGI